VVDRAEPGSGDDHDWEAEFSGEITQQKRFVERHEQAADAFDHAHLRRSCGGQRGLAQRSESEWTPGELGSQMR